MKILIVDDDSGDRLAIKRLLSRSGALEVLKEAETVDEALAFEEMHFDAIFLDYNLPGASGLNSLEEFRETWPRAAIFFMTGLGDEDLAKSAILGGASDYIVKSRLSDPALATQINAGVAAAKQRHRIEEQHADMATFVEVLVHDFRAPIRAAAYLAEQIEEDISAGELDEVSSSLGLLRASAGQMMSMISSLSDHVRFDRDTIVERANPETLIQNAADSLALEIKASSAKVSWTLDDTIPDIECQPPQIVMVLQNLIGNAIKYSGDAPPRIHIKGSMKSGMMLLLEVEDQGAGIPQQYLKRIFEPFKRVPGADTIKGTGLGLATCKKIVLRHGGHISCQSELGVGTKMSICIPVEARDPGLLPLGRSQEISGAWVPAVSGHGAPIHGSVAETTPPIS